jgi:glucose/arabinose dehydrogenase
MKMNLTKIVCLSVALTSAIWHTNAQNLPKGFAVQELAELRSPTCMAFAPDGRIFIGEQEGEVKVFKNGKLLDIPAFTIPSIKYIGEKGLIGIAVHPQFESNKYVYVFYTKTQPGFNYDLIIDRYTMNGDVGENQTQILYIARVSSRWYDIWNHNGGGLNFGNDGKLYIGVGYNDQFNQTALTNPFGKVLRINDDGTSPSDNPLYENGGNTSTNQIYATGMRNPFSLTFIKKSTNTMVLADVGSSAPGGREEINLITEGGKNLGFPDKEGTSNDESLLDPAYAYLSTDQLSTTVETINGCAVTASTAFYPSNSNYPSEYLDKVYFMDFCNGWLSYLSIDNSGKASRFPFGTALGKFGKGSGHVALTEGKDGNLYFLTRLSRTLDPSGEIQENAKGVLKRIVFESNIAVDKSNNLQLFCTLEPNPANDVFSVNFISEKNENCEVTITDILGVEQLRNMFNTIAGENENDINIASLKRGTYMVKIKNGQYLAYKKLVVE